MEIINTDTGEYKFKKLDFENKTPKVIDREISKINLLELKEILDYKKIEFGLIYGTLLGAVREKNFIKHDEDIDIFMLIEDRPKFINLLFNLREKGFELIRDENGLMSIMRNNEYIDIYFFKKAFWGYRKWATQYIKSDHLEKEEFIKFFDKKFRVPFNHILFLEKNYGKNWKTPIKNKPAKSRYFIGKYKEFIKKIFNY